MKPTKKILQAQLFLTQQRIALVNRASARFHSERQAKLANPVFTFRRILTKQGKANGIRFINPEWIKYNEGYQALLATVEELKTPKLCLRWPSGVMVYNDSPFKNAAIKDNPEPYILVRVTHATKDGMPFKWIELNAQNKS